MLRFLVSESEAQSLFGLDVRILEFDDLKKSRWFIKGPLRHLKKIPEDYKKGIPPSLGQECSEYWQVLGGPPVPSFLWDRLPQGETAMLERKAIHWISRRPAQKVR